MRSSPCCACDAQCSSSCGVLPCVGPSTVPGIHIVTVRSSWSTMATLSVCVAGERLAAPAPHGTTLHYCNAATRRPVWKRQQLTRCGSSSARASTNLRIPLPHACTSAPPRPAPAQSQDRSQPPQRRLRPTRCSRGSPDCCSCGTARQHHRRTDLHQLRRQQLPRAVPAHRWGVPGSAGSPSRLLRCIFAGVRPRCWRARLPSLPPPPSPAVLPNCVIEPLSTPAPFCPCV